MDGGGENDLSTVDLCTENSKKGESRKHHGGHGGGVDLAEKEQNKYNEFFLLHQLIQIFSSKPFSMFYSAVNSLNCNK